MTKRTEIDVREVVRVIFSGLAAYVTVDLFILPYLFALGIAFPTYFYLGMAATVVLATGIALVLRPRAETAPEDAGEMVPPAE